MLILLSDYINVNSTTHISKLNCGNTRFTFVTILFFSSNISQTLQSNFKGMTWLGWDP